MACTAAIASLVPVALFQTGVLDALPDPPGELFDSEAVVSSREAHPFGVPDSLPGIGAFGLALALILMARRDTAARRLLGLELAALGVYATGNVGLQVVRFGRLCSWCTATALATGVMVCMGREAIADTAADGLRLMRRS